MESDEEDEGSMEVGDGEPDDAALLLPTKFHGCFSSKHISDLVSDFGLGGMNWLKSGLTYNRKFVYWLLARMDVKSMWLMLGNGSYIDLTKESVESVLGVSCTGESLSRLCHEVNEETLKDLRRWLQVQEGMPSLDDAKQVVSQHWGDDLGLEKENKFAVAMTALCCGYMFGPRDRVTIPRDIINVISSPENLRNFNWASYILHVISSAAQKVLSEMHKSRCSVLLGGCWLYLEVIICIL